MKNDFELCQDLNTNKMFETIWAAGVEMGYFTPEQKPPLYIQKSVRRYGSCYTKVIGYNPHSYNSNIRKVLKIVIHPGCIQHPDFCKEVLVHEVAHAAVALKYGSVGHQHLFYAIGEKLASKFDCKISRLTSDTYGILQKNEYHKICYFLECPECGHKYGPRYKMTEKMGWLEKINGYKCKCGATNLHWHQYSTDILKKEV